jgi:hypothetical protein
LLHVCFDGSTLRDRASLLRNGFTPPVRSLVKKSDPSFLKLTPDDIDLLIGMKIKW